MSPETFEQPNWIDPAAPGATVGRRVATRFEGTAGNRLEQAVTRFSASGASRIVAGLMRTLGRPCVSIGAAAGSPSEIRITVAWELCWYQWVVDVADEGRPVFEVDRGDELTQLDGPARQWNASIGPGGRVALGVAGRRRPRAGEPVG